MEAITIEQPGTNIKPDDPLKITTEDGKTRNMTVNDLITWEVMTRYQKLMDKDNEEFMAKHNEYMEKRFHATGTPNVTSGATKEDNTASKDARNFGGGKM